MTDYGQFCTVARGAEIFGERWTPLVVRELLCGSTRFNDIRRGVPRMSATLLAQRLRKLEEMGVVRRVRGDGGWEYRLTPAGEELRPIVLQIGHWGLANDWLDGSEMLHRAVLAIGAQAEGQARVDPQALPIASRSVDAVLENPATRTADLGGALGGQGLVLVAQQCASVAELKKHVTARHQVLDVNGWPELMELPCKYEGFCW